ncbi:MAG: cobalt transporter CbiM [Deltaproteobacteria bacterium]|nr:cobalt transporter CbiM [Deltaproteobacteria bacterium]
MHISEGVLSAPVLGAGAALAAAGIAVGLKKMDYDRLPQVALLSAVFFVACLIHVPVGPSSVHLVLNGLMGLILGWAAFPAIFVGLVLQAVLFQFGGLTVLGVNTVTMAAPAVVLYYALHPLLKNGGKVPVIVAGFLAGSLAVLLAAILTAASLVLSDTTFTTTAGAFLLSSLPGAAVEGLITAAAAGFLRQVKPGLLTAGS